MASPAFVGTMSVSLAYSPAPSPVSPTINGMWVCPRRMFSVSCPSIWDCGTAKRSSMMDIPSLIIESHPALEDVRFLEARLYEYGVEQTGVDDGQWLAIFLRDDQQTIQAGLKGWTWC